MSLALFEGFVNPALLAGLGLASVPIIIHLLNRQRHQPMPWAAMRFVLAAYKQTRRRVRFEDWLLLLLRTLAILALALAVARPFSGSDGPLAGLTETRRDLAIVLDGSASTGYRGELNTVFERSVERTRELIGELSDQRGDRCFLILGGSTAEVLSNGNLSQARSALEALTDPTDESFDLPSALAQVLEIAKEEAASTQESRVEIRLLSDLQRSTFDQALALEDSEGDLAQSGLGTVLDQLEALGLKVQVEDLSNGDSRPPNLSIEAIEVEGPWLGVGVPVDLRVRVANHGQEPRVGLRVALEINGVRRPSQLLDLDPGSKGEAIFPAVFDRSGEHALIAHLEGDRLPVDDHLAEVLFVPEPVSVLVVNGAPHIDFEKDAAARVMVILEPSLDGENLGSESAPFAPKEVTPRELENGDVEFGGYDLVWLMNVASLAPEVLTQLEEHVAGGASLVMSLGDQVMPNTFNKQFFRLDGSGLSPAQLGELVAVASRRSNYYRVATFDETHPALALFAEDRWKSLLTEAPFYNFMPASPLESARVLANLDDRASSALLIERDFDRGRVLLWTSSLEDSWTGFPSWGPALVPFVYDLVRDAGRPARPSRRIAPRGSLLAEVSAFPRNMELVTPTDARIAIESEAREIRRGQWQLPAVEGSNTARVGLYRIETEGAGQHLFAVQLDREESVLERLQPGELTGIHSAFELLNAESSEEDAGGLPNGHGELWRPLALIALLALIAESLWSAWIGRRRLVL